MNNDNDFPYILQFIGAMTILGILAFMLFCTVKQMDSWVKSSQSTCEVTVQKE